VKRHILESGGRGWALFEFDGDLDRVVTNVDAPDRPAQRLAPPRRVRVVAGRRTFVLDRVSGGSHPIASDPGITSD